MNNLRTEQTLVCNGRTLAYRQQPGRLPGVLFLGGFRSDMTGTKAHALAAWCEHRGHRYTRFDYSGHGGSSGRFADGTISHWLKDATAILDQLTSGPQILVGSSMGGWIALLLARSRPQRLHSLLTIACATDFTERLIRPALNPQQRAEVEHEGLTTLPSDYDQQPYPITRQLLDNGRQHLLLGQPIPLDCPVRLLHGDQDRDVPLAISEETAHWIEGPDTQLIRIQQGDHRLSKPAELDLITETLEQLLAI